MTQLSFEDFYKVPEMQFDISRLREDLDRVLEKKGFDSLGLSHFGAIPVNQIPNDEESIKGHNMRGIYWTTPDESGKEVARDINIDEEKYTQLIQLGNFYQNNHKFFGLFLMLIHLHLYYSLVHDLIKKENLVLNLRIFLQLILKHPLIPSHFLY